MDKLMLKIVRLKTQINLLSYLFLFFLMLIILSCSSEKKKIENPNSKEYQKIEVTQELKEMGKIKENKIKERRTYSKFTTNYIPSGGKEILAEKIHFDEKGNKLEQIRYRSDGVDMQTLFSYDEFGNYKTIETFDGYHNLMTKTNYEFSSVGILLKKETEKNNAKTYYEYEYDENFNLTRINLYNNNRALYEYSIYKYAANNLDSIIVFSNGFITQISFFNYNSQNRLTKDNSIINKYYKKLTTYEYDNYGNILKVFTPKLANWEYSYDSKGNILEEINTDKDGNLQARFTYSYNEENNLLLGKLRYDGNNVEALEIRFEYDFY
jgi:YD repeat-containing protein